MTKSKRWTLSMIAFLAVAPAVLLLGAVGGEVPEVTKEVVGEKVALRAAVVAAARTGTGQDVPRQGGDPSPSEEVRDDAGVFLFPPAMTPEVLAADQSVPVFLEGLARGEWFAGVRRAMDSEWYAGVQQWLDQQAAAARRTPARSRSGGGGSGVGDCTGFPIPDSVIQRESTGNMYAENPSGAFGCTQIMPGWWGGACSHLDKYTIQGQRDCTQIVLELQGPSAWAETW